MEIHFTPEQEAQLAQIAQRNDDELVEFGMLAHPADKIESHPRFKAEPEDHGGRN